MNHIPVPAIPGTPIKDDSELKSRIAALLDLKSYKFPGAQPVSFYTHQLDELINEDYYVAEKSDGVRCLAYITVNKAKEQEVYLFDRKNNFHRVSQLWFPIPQDPSFRKFHTDTIIDGELVLDVESNGTTRLRFLLFDCLVVGKNILIKRDFEKRLGYLKMEIMEPHDRMLGKMPHLIQRRPFVVSFKYQQFTYKLDKVFSDIIPNLKHGNDGLIFTSVSAPYLLGTTPKIIKWKPANENSIDFKILLKFPGNSLPGVANYTAMPRISLMVWAGSTLYEYFDELGITEDEWRTLSGNRPTFLHEKIVECNFDPEIQEKLGLKSPWRFMRLRNDKLDGNHRSTVDNVLRSIKDAVSKEQLIDAIPDIWKGFEKRREEARKRRYDTLKTEQDTVQRDQGARRKDQEAVHKEYEARRKNQETMQRESEARRKAT
ncbi:mRNA-capping enzyme subunit alpha [Spinellus fusiger]|nr:mRNA-capping enzyme subunit alpha [Spinellus fusiger]